MHFKMKIEPLTMEWGTCMTVPRCYDDDLNQYLADSESSDNEYRTTHDKESLSQSNIWLATSANVVYNCGDCQKDFKYRHELKMHARKHSRLHAVYVKNQNAPFHKFKKRMKREPISSSDSESPEPPSIRKVKRRLPGIVPRNLFNSYPEKPMHFENEPQVTPLAVKIEFNLKTQVETSGTPGHNIGDKSKSNNREEVPCHVKEAPGSPMIKSDVEQNKRYKCRVCYRRFFTRGALIIHGRQHDHLRTKKCNICGKTFIKADCLKNHVNRHKKLGFYRTVDLPETQNKESECQNMDENVPDIELETNQELVKPPFQEHRFSRVSKMPYNCRVCHMSFAFRGDLVKHGSVHDDLRCKKCHICGKTFVMKDSLKSHINRHRSPFSIVSNSNSNSVHKVPIPVKKKAKTKYKQCDVCGKKISNIGNLHKHVIRMHSDTFLYKCDYCRARFQQTSDLDKHLERHKKRRPYKCDNCCKLFATSIELRVHFKRSHTDENMLTFHCDKCSKRCATGEDLAKHARVHEGLKPHKCGLCSKAFRTISGRDAHAWECYGILSICL